MSRDAQWCAAVLWVHLHRPVAVHLVVELQSIFGGAGRSQQREQRLAGLSARRRIMTTRRPHFFSLPSRESSPAHPLLGPRRVAARVAEGIQARYTALRLASRVTEEPEAQAARKAGVRGKRKILP